MKIHENGIYIYFILIVIVCSTNIIIELFKTVNSIILIRSKQLHSKLSYNVINYYNINVINIY